MSGVLQGGQAGTDARMSSSAKARKGGRSAWSLGDDV